MNLNKLLKKSLLVGAALLVGASGVSAQMTAFTQDFTVIGTSTDPADYGFSVTTYNAATATVTGGLLQYSLPANSSKDVSAWGTASFTPIPTGNVVTISCSWNPGGPTGTRPYSTLRIYGSDGTSDKVVLSLYNQGQDKDLLLGNYDGTGTVLVDNNADWRSGSNVWNVVAVLNLNTQKVTSLTITKSGQSTPAVSQSNIDFENTVININKFEFGTNKKSNGAVTSTLDNVLVTYEAAASTADVTFKYEDVDGNDLSAIKADAVEKAEVGSTVSGIISSALTAAFLNGDESKKYTYSTFTCSDATVPAGGTTVTLKFNAHDKFTYNVNAVDGEDNLIGNIASVSGYTGDNLSLYWSKYVKISDQWYETSTTSFYQDGITAAGTKKVLFTESDIAYFVECEKMNGVRSDRIVTETSESNSGYHKVRINNYYPTIYTAEFAEGGVFDIAIPYNNSNDTEHTYQLRTRTSAGILSEIITTWTAPKGTSSFAYSGLVVPAGSSVAISCDGISGNSNARMDYLTLTQSKVSPTIGADGYATYSSAYALDFEHATGVKGYYSTSVSGNSAVMTKITGTAAAGEGLFLQKTDGEISIPVVATGTTLTGNLLKATDGNDIPASAGGTYNYVFAKQSGELGFYKVTSDLSGVAAGKAYLQTTTELTAGSRLNISFGDETTGIDNLTPTLSKGDGSIYNLNGQRVAAPTKGLYIMNGKKVIVK